MIIKGTIRRHSDETDIAFVSDNKWHNLLESPLKSTILSLYSFVLSPSFESIVLGQSVKKELTNIKGNDITTVIFNTPIFQIKLIRYSRGIDGKVIPPDRVSINIIFPTSSSSED